MSEWSIIVAPAVAEMKALEKRTERATMWALRQTARDVAKVAKKHARVYEGDRGDVVRGQLKKSIKPARRIRKSGNGTFSITVGPRFPGILYAARIEAIEPFMAPAHATGSANHEANAMKAYRRSMERG